MLNSMRPPTDNLYKFMAIFGLVLIGFGLWLGNQQFNRHVDAQSRASESLQEAWIEIHENDALRELLHDQMQRVREGETIYGLSLKAALIDGVTEQQIAAVKKFEFIGHESSVEIAKTKIYRWPIAAPGGVGIFLAGYGFLLWWRRVQRYEDIILRQKALEQAPEEVAEAEKSLVEVIPLMIQFLWNKIRRKN